MGVVKSKLKTSATKALKTLRVLVIHCKEIQIYVFPEKELQGLSSNFHIHISVSNLYTVFPRSICPFGWLQQNRWTILGIYKSLTDV